MPSPRDPLQRVVIIDGRRALYCPVCSVDQEDGRPGRWVVLARHCREGKTLSAGEIATGEFVATPCATFSCHYCGYAEVYLREPKERREADEERRRAESA